MQLRAAIVGAGLMGRWHAHTIRKLGHDVVYVLDSDEQAARNLANTVGASFSTDLKETLCNAAIDVVHVCTPLEYHYQISEIALECSKHVVCEKPLARYPGEVKKLLDLAQRNRRQLCPVYQFVFQKGTAQVIQEIREEAVIPISVEFSIASAGAAGKSEVALNEAIVEILPHPFSILARLFPRYALDQVDWYTSSPVEGETLISAQMGLVIISIRISMKSRPTECGFLVRSESGNRSVDLYHGYSVKLSPRVSRFRKMINPIDQSLRILGISSSNLMGRLLNREFAYPGLSTLIDNLYTSLQSTNSHSGKDQATFSNSEIQSISGACSVISSSLTGKA